MELTALGFDEDFARAFAPWADESDVRPGRVVIGFNHLLRVQTEVGECEASVSGRLKHAAMRQSELPAVGDWVALRRPAGADRGVILAVLPRRSRFSRRAAGQVTDEQVVAANLDVVFVVTGLDADFSIRRIERFLVLVKDSGARPVVLLTKPDLARDLTTQVSQVRAVASDAPLYVLNPRTGEGLEALRHHLIPGSTGALLGSSGVGKTTIVNQLTGGAEGRRTQAVRMSDSKGRHTTPHRELVVLPGGALLIDTPGMRELQLWHEAPGQLDAFDDIDTLAAACHFSNCRHMNEPRCAVKAAVADGRVTSERLESYRKLRDELVRLDSERVLRARIDAKRQSRVASKALRAHLRDKRG